MPAPFITRFAPSPTGLLHRGHAFSALTAFEAACAAEGRLLLRIEDIDAARSRPKFEAAIHEDLAWLGLTFAPPVRKQSEHFDDYRAAIARLDAMGLIYPAFESRTEIARLVAEREAKSGEPWPRDPDGGPRYPEFSKSLPAKERRRLIETGAPYALRLDMTAALARSGPLHWDESGETVAADPSAWGDIILARKDLGVAYHLAVVVDDALQGVSHVIRGADLFEAAQIQRLLQALLGLPTPIYRHHRLLLRPDGKRFAKRDTAETLRDLRARGITAAALRAELGF